MIKLQNLIPSKIIIILTLDDEKNNFTRIIKMNKKKMDYELRWIRYKNNFKNVKPLFLKL